MVVKGWPRLSETFVARELLGLERRGFSLRVVSIRGPREAQRQPVAERLRAPVHYLPPEGARGLPALLAAAAATVARRPRAALAALRRALGRVRARGAEPLRRWLEACWLVEALRLGRGSSVRHLHAHFLHAPAELAEHAASMSGLGFSATGHARDIYTSPPEELAARVGAADFVLTCTDYNRRHLCALPGVDGRRVRLCYHGVELEAFPPAASCDTSRLLSVGRLVPKKGHDQVLRALALLRAHGEEFQWELFGAGPLEAGLKALAAELGLGSRAAFHGAVAHPRLAARLSEGGVAVFGCVEAEDGDRDGLPNALLEAMAAGLPVVATAVSAIPEALRDGVDGLLVPPRDPAALAAALRRLRRDPVLAARLGASARERARAFDAESCLDECARSFAALESLR